MPVKERAARTTRKDPAKFEEERRVPPLQPKTENQAAYLRALRSEEQIVVMGPAGTGKTYMAAVHAADMFRQRRVSKIILARPNMPVGRTLGYDKGDEAEKIAPWARPMTSAIKERMGAGAFEIALAKGDIEIVPFEKIRGLTFKDCIVILDEAQNTAVDEIKTFLTRIGENCQVIVNGDITQSDLDKRISSGLSKAVHLIKHFQLPVPIIEFGFDDIVRSGICRQWVIAFHEAGL